MPFKMKVTVPRITASDIAEMEKLVPGLSMVVNIPLISKENVKNVAITLGERRLVKYEYVREVESITETDTGWVAILQISGD